ncbi:MAG: hypothetical protein ACYC3S_12480 [Chloroflexota bacterium]
MSLDVFMAVLLLVLQVGIAFAAFFGVLTGYLPPRLRLPVRAALTVQWLVLLGFAFFLIGWLFGLLSILLSPIYMLLSRPVAARYAQRLRR